MSNEPSTTIQWTMRLSDARLIAETLLKEAESRDGMADYLESPGYAKSQASAHADRQAELPNDERTEWEQPESDLKRIVAHRAAAVRLRILAES